MKKRLRYLLFSLLFFVPAQLLAQTANHVVISEIYGGGGSSTSTYANDFIELYNPTGADVDISNWSVQIASATAKSFAADGQAIIPAGTTIKAHAYFLIQGSSGATASSPLPTPDLISPLAVAAGSGQVALVNNPALLTADVANGTGIVDFVGYGATAITYEGNGPAPAPSNSKSIERKALTGSTATTMAAGGADDMKGNGYDSDNNATDFFVANVTNPQNSSSPAETPPAGTPVLITSITSLDFGTTQTVGTPVAKSFTISGSNLTADVTISTTAPFLVSKDNVTFTNAVTFTAAELITSTNPSVYVQFTPTGASPATGNVTITSTDIASQTVALTGTGAPVAPTGADHVVISEIYGGGGSSTSVYANDFIELYNPTSTAVDMSNWSVQLAAATGPGFTAAAQVIIPAGTAIKSHGYFLIQGSNGATASVALPTPDLVSNLAVAAGSGQVALVNNSALLTADVATGTGIVDFVGYGTIATTYEGSGPAPAPSNPKSIERKALATSTAATMAVGGADDMQGNGYDSNNNANDFFVPVSVNPQNSSSPIEPATTGTPTLTASVISLDFGTMQGIGRTISKSFTVSGSNLTANTIVSTASPFLVSKDNVTFSDSVSFTAAELAVIPSPNIYVQFTPTNTNAVTGNLTIASTGITSQTLALTGTGASVTLNPANHVVISEIYGGGGSSTGIYSNDFIELYNPTSANVDISNWSVQFAAAGGPAFTADAVTIFPANSTIKAHGYFLIQESKGATVTPPLPTPDMSGTISIAAGSGQVALVNNPTLLTTDVATGSGIVDFVGYGATATVYEGSGPAPAPSNSKSIERKAVAASNATTMAAGGADDMRGNGYDTDNNANDFFVVSLTNPQNSSSPIEPGIPTLTATPSTPLTFSQVAGTTSAPQTVAIAGNNLFADVTVATTAPYMVSKDGKTFSTSVIYTTTELALAQTVYIQFTPTAIGNANSHVTISSTGATNQTITLNGTGLPPPTLTATPETLTFTNQTTGTTSASQGYSLSGTNLTANTIVTVTGPFTVSKDSVTYSTSISYTSAELATTQTVYVKFTPTATGALNGSVTNTTEGLSSPAIVTLNGTGIAPVPVLTASPGTIDFGNLTVGTVSSAQVYSLSGANLTDVTTITTAAPYSVSKDGITYATSISYSPTELAVPQRVSVQFSPMVAGSANGSTVQASTGVASQTVTLTGTGVAGPVPALVITPTILTFNQVIGTAPSAQTYTLSGANLTDNATITTAAPYSISKDGATYSTSLGYTPAELATAQTVYVEFTPTEVGDANGNIIQTTTGATSQTLILNGTGIGIPILTATPGSLTFNQIEGTTSAAQTYILSGEYLADNVTVTTATPYSISKDGITYSTSLSYTPTELTTAQTVYVQFSPATAGTANGIITMASTGATSQMVTLNGTGLNTPVLTVTPASLTFNQTIGTTSPAQTYMLSGSYLADNTTVTTTAPYSISKDGTTYSTSISYTPAELATAQTVYVKFSPTAAGAANGNTIQATNGAISQTVTFNGTGTTNQAPTLDPVADQIVCASTAQQIIPLSGIIAGPETDQSVNLFVSSSDPAIQLSVLPVSSTGTSQILYTLTNNASSTGTITVTVKDNGGTANGGTDTYASTFNITVNSLPVVNITSDVGTSITKGITAVLTATGGTKYSWSTSSDITGPTDTATISVRPQETTTYTVTATNASGCITVQTITITVNNTTPAIIANNIITPNGDDKNDTWVVKNIDQYPGNTVKVFDKTGKLVFAKTDYQNDWDGHFNSAPLPQGTYYYVIDLGNSTSYKGYISIVRD